MSTSSPSQSKHLLGPPPFDDKQADVILRSEKGVNFYVHKSILILLSPFFETMFQLPQGPATTTSSSALNEEIDGRPVITIPESSQALGALLSWCDPRSIPLIPNIHTALEVANLAVKYDMQHIVARIGDRLTREPDMVAQDPLALYAFATRHHIDSLARLAAKKFLAVDISKVLHSPSDLEHIPASALLDLLNYVYRSRQEIMSAVGEGYPNQIWVHWSREPQGLCFNGGKKTACRSSECDTKWFKDYKEAVKVVLRQDLLGTRIRDTESFAADFIARAKLCPDRCESAGERDLWKWTNALIQKIDDSVAEVKRVDHPHERAHFGISGPLGWSLS